MADNQPIITADLSGQNALVTGASRGIGRAVALALGRCGAKVACVARNAEKLAETVAAITEAGGSAEAFSCDVTSTESVNKVVEEIAEKWERIDILVNNAGITRDTLLLRMDDEQWDSVLETNLKGTFLFTRAGAKVMLSQRYGRIINITSVVGFMGNPGQANYSASKAGVIGFTRTVARELGKTQDYGQCGGPRVYYHRYDRGPAGPGARRNEEADSRQSAGKPRGCGRDGPVFGKPGCCLYHRADCDRGRRNDCLSHFWCLWKSRNRLDFCHAAD